ncbi:Mob1/phocein, partial [Aureobasidium melanogenum]
MAAVSPARSGVSPSSSPRLPSPPPIPEVQFGPQSPGMGDISKELSLDATSKPDEGAARRIRPGTKAAEMAMGPPLVPLSQLDSPFQLQEHLKSLYSHFTHNPGSTHTIPISREAAVALATPPQINETETVDRNLWLYELCRFLTQKANIVSIFLMNDNPPCSALTCQEMRASEWQYLCAVHEPPKSCCAIDYCNHTLDWAANVLTSPKHFPSRLALGGEAGGAIQSMRQLTNIFRRVYRIFAHAWFQHRDVFWSIEATYGLYMLFKVVCDEFHLIPEDSYTIPPDAEDGREPIDEAERDRDVDRASAPAVGSRVQILRKDVAPLSGTGTPSEDPSTLPSSSEDAAAGTTTTVSTAATARRHRHTPSTGSHVATITEQHEDEEEVTSAIVVPKASSHPFTMTSGTSRNEVSSESRSPPKQKPDLHADNTAGQGQFPKLDIASTVPRYEPHAPADPTPTGTAEDIDPLSASTQQPTPTLSSEETEEEPARHEHAAPAAEEDHAQADDHGQAEVEAQEQDKEQEEEVTSPSGGSIRTGGPDVLKAILGHISDDGEQEGSQPQLEAKDIQKAEKSMSSSPPTQQVAKSESSSGSGALEGHNAELGTQHSESESQKDTKNEDVAKNDDDPSEAQDRDRPDEKGAVEAKKDE